MASTSTLGPVSSSTRRIYDVFLSFYGKDTRNNFVDHLHAALKGKGIVSFRDDEKLERGKVISPELMQAIQDSQYAIVVISKNYAFSKWCLIELTKIMECKSETGLNVLPIFYNVDPSDVRKQNDSFGQAIDEHGEDSDVDKEEIEMWKSALKDVGNLAGWHINNSPESVVIEDICQKIRNEWTHCFPIISEGFVGMASRIEKMISLLHIGLEDVSFIGICGMGGIGKTTLAKVIYDHVSPQFEASCFIANIREEAISRGLVHLQKQIIYKILGESRLKIWNTDDGTRVMSRRLCNKDVFIILDDVDSKDQLEALLGRYYWYSPRSRVIVTTRNRHLLQQYEDVEIYEQMELSEDESLELFSRKAFKKDHPIENFMKLSKDIVGYAQGLPLALEVFGSYLCGRSLVAWEAAQKQLKETLDPNICEKLKISYNGLKVSQKELFLDIAYLFKGQCNNKEVGVLKVVHPYFGIDIEVLKDQCLIKNSKEYFKFCMHDLLREMGQQIACEKFPNEPGKWSRLNSFDCIYHISKHNLATDAVEKIVLQPPFEKDKKLSFEIFSRMTKLKVFVINKGWYGNYLVEHNASFPHLHWCGNASKFSLSNELRILQWPGYPLQCLPTTFHPKNLVELKMPHSRIKGKWGGWKGLDNLKYIDMRNSVDLIEISDLSGIPNLESLDLRNCNKLREVDASLGFLKRLQKLNMEGCQRLERFLDVISLESLQHLNLAGCSRLKAFPNIQGHMSSLTYINMTETMIRQLLSSFNRLSSLEYLNFCSFLRCQKLHEIPITYNGKTGTSCWPFWRDGRSFLRGRALDVDRNGSTPWFFIPNVFSNPSRFLVPNLSSLRELDLSYLHLPDATFPDLSSLPSIQCLNLSGNKLTTIPYSICKLPNLVGLHLRDCKSLQQLELLSCLRSLKLLNLAYCNLSDGMIPDNLGFLSSLQFLSLSGNKFRKVPYLVQLSKLNYLYLDDCLELQVFPELPLNLRMLNLSSCPSLEICCCKMDPSTSSGNSTSFMAINFDSDGRPYKIPHPHPPKDINSVYYQVTVGIARAYGVPDWFNRKTIELHLRSTPDSWEGCVLLILYEVHEHGSSDNGTSDGSTRTLPQFVCKFQFNKIAVASFRFCAPEVPSVGLNGLWVIIHPDWFLWGAGIEGCLECSIESCSLNVEVRVCTARSVDKEDFSEFSEVINSISPHPLDFISWLPLATCIRQRDLTNLFSV